MEAIYTANALSTGDGRSGHTESADGKLSLDMAPPKELGGTGEGSNPEQLFAAGYAACFHSALHVVARKAKKDIEGSSVGARVSIGEEGEGYGLSVALEVSIPALSQDEAQELADKAHQVCPYSRATQGNIDVDITVKSN